MKTKIKKVPCKILGRDGNAFAIIARVNRALKKSGQPDLVDKFTAEATSGDYYNLLCVVHKYCYDPDDEEETA